MKEWKNDFNSWDGFGTNRMSDNLNANLKCIFFNTRHSISFAFAVGLRAKRKSFFRFIHKKDLMNKFVQKFVINDKIICNFSGIHLRLIRLAFDVMKRLLLNRCSQTLLKVDSKNQCLSYENNCYANSRPLINR